jgi:hypothetical protein
MQVPLAMKSGRIHEHDSRPRLFSDHEHGTSPPTSFCFIIYLFARILRDVLSPCPLPISFSVFNDLNGPRTRSGGIESFDLAQALRRSLS